MQSNTQTLGFVATMVQTLKDIFANKGIMLILLVAPLIYGLYYPFAYSTEVARNIPVAVVDKAQDSLSRELMRSLQASPTLQLEPLQNEETAQQKLLDNSIMAYVVIPTELRANVLKNNTTAIQVVGNNNYIVASKNAQASISAVVQDLSVNGQLKGLYLHGGTGDKASDMLDPIPLKIDALFNPHEGYGHYVVPAVIWLILQQTLLMATAMLCGYWYQQQRMYAKATTWLARISMLSVLHYGVCILYTGWLMSFWGYNAGGNPLGNLLLIALFSPAVAALGCVLGVVVKNQERVMQLMILTSLPIYFTSGFSWPMTQLPLIFEWIGYLFPTTAAINAGVAFNQMNALVVDNLHYLASLLFIMLVSLCIVTVLSRKHIHTK